MPTKLWTSIERTASLLEPAERQSVLGDIQERGPDVRALLDLIGLVLLRQLQSFKSWRTWLVTASMLLPVFWIATVPTGVGGFARAYPALSAPQLTRYLAVIVWAAIGTPILSWSTGFAIGALGKQRTPVVLLLLAIYSVKFAYPRMHDTEWLLILTIAPAIFGSIQGYRGRSLRPLSLAILMILSALSIAFVFEEANANVGLGVSLSLGVGGLWPLVFALRPRPVYN
ncbi:MAG: hypothetical protein ABIR70_14060 [Bryobacteraceae bacterium]